ncbi:MAG: amidohydrolase family protein [Planctomycetota bacterium]|jgi:predicted TIM-barrel fold metal-dependent hydrolase
MLIDCHSHLRETNSRADWIWFEDEDEGPLALERFLVRLRKEPVDHVILSGGSAGLGTPEKLAAANAAVAEAARIAPDFVSGLCQANPHLAEESLAQIDEHVADGNFVGIGELCQYIVGYETDDPTVFPIIERAIELDVPVLVHASVKEHTDGVDRLAARFPKANLIMAHIGGMYNWSAGLAVAAAHDNVWVDTSGFVMLRPGAMQRALSEIGPGKMVFGVDFPLVTVGPLRSVLEGLSLPPEDFDRIAWRNAAELFRLDLSATA